jgi:hypothetical protein
MMTGGRPLALVHYVAQLVQIGASAYDVISVATWALLLCLVARGSRSSVTQDLFN